MDRIYVMELVRSFQVGGIDRRTFLARASRALGSVAAANLLLTACQHGEEETPPPVVERARREDAPAAVAAAGLAAGMVDYPGRGAATLSGYLARPEGDGSYPAVAVLQEWWGLDAHIQDVARRLAAEGFVALAPDLYHGAVTSEPDEARKLVMQLDRDAAVAEICSALAYLLAQPFVRGAWAGVVGFCMGGWLVLQTAIEAPEVGASVAFYGRPLTAEEAARVKAPVMGNYGALDAGIPVENVEAMAAALEAAGMTTDVKVYEGAPHAFFNDTRPSHHAEAAADAWARTLAWFRRHLE